MSERTPRLADGRWARDPYGILTTLERRGDHARMLAALGREQDREPLATLRRPIELERELHRGLYIER